MKAVVANRYGGSEMMRLVDVATPTVGEGAVLVAIRATSLQALDWHLQRGDPAVVRLGEGLRRPKRTIHGVDIAGVVAEVGTGVTDLRVGDEVFGWSDDGGGLAECVVVPRDHVHARPSGVSLEESATIGVAAFTALQMVRDHAAVAAGDRVLVVGASGGVGHFAVQLCKAAGAHVTGVCSARNLAMVADIGADVVLDRTETDWSAADQTWDVILQIAGTVPFRRARRVLAPDGRYAMAGINADGRWLGPMKPFLALMVRARFDRRVSVVRARENAADLRALGELVEAGALRPVIDRRFTLAEAADAMRYVHEGRASGKVVVTIPAEAVAPEEIPADMPDDRGYWS